MLHPEELAMNKLMFLAPLGVLLTSMSANAQSPFDGTWKIDVSKVDFSKKPDVYLLKDHMYSCESCTPPYTINADGRDQAVNGHPYFDTVAITVVNDQQIKEVDKKNGKVVGRSTVTVSSDGKTANFEFSDQSDTNGGPPVTGKGQSELVEPGPDGSHAVSGSWRVVKMDSMSSNGLTVTFKTSGDRVTMTNPTGQTYTAKFGGPDAPMKGDPGVTSVAVKRIGNTLEETDKRDGKVIGILKLTVEGDGRTANASYTDVQQNRTNSFVMAKR
jgi:hypothetical protein